MDSVKAATLLSLVQRGTTEPALAAAETTTNLCYLCTITLLMYTVASPDPNPNPRGRGQQPNSNVYNSTLTSATRGETQTPNPNECNSTLMSGSSRAVYNNEWN